MDAGSHERGREVRLGLLARLVPLLLLAPVASAQAAGGGTTGRLLVTLAPPVPGRAVAAAGEVVGRAGGRPARGAVAELRLVTARARPGRSLAALARRLRADPAVRSVQLEHRFALRALPDDPALSTAETAEGTPPGVPVEWWAERQGLPGAWDVPGTHGATVAVIDTGVDATHPELSGRIARATDRDATPGAGPATTDETGHGTHVASLACATADNGIGIAGAGYDCRLLIFKSDLSDGSVAASIVDATQQGAEAINMSFGTTGDVPAADVVREALRYASDRGVVLVSAAADAPVEEQGDPSNVLQPAGTGADLARGLGLSVTAAGFDDTRAGFAGYGSEVSLAAYGAWSTGRGGPRGLLGAFPAATVALERLGPGVPPVPSCRCRASFLGDARYAYIQGTSMASPMVAAAAAMVKHLNPDLSAGSVVRLLKRTARRPAGTGWTPDLGWGILDAGAAVAVARTIDRRGPSTRVRVAETDGRTLTLRLSGTDRAPAGVRASGLARFELYRSKDGAPAHRIARTTRHTVRLRIRRGFTYAFSAVGVDRAGNREKRPVRPDARLRLKRL